MVTYGFKHIELGVLPSCLQPARQAVSAAVWVSMGSTGLAGEQGCLAPMVLQLRSVWASLRKADLC